MPGDTPGGILVVAAADNGLNALEFALELDCRGTGVIEILGVVDFRLLEV